MIILNIIITQSDLSESEVSISDSSFFFLSYFLPFTFYNLPLEPFVSSSPIIINSVYGLIFYNFSNLYISPSVHT